MKRLKILLMGVIWGLSCREGTNNPGPLPPAPNFVTSTPDTSAMERGIDTVPDYNAIRIEWVSDLLYENYALYRKAAHEDVFLRIHTASAGDSAFVDMINIELNTRYFYYLKGMDETGNWSAPSDTIDYQLIPKVNNLVYSQPDSSFYWTRQEIPPRFFIIKLYTKSDNQLIWRYKIEPIYHQSVQHVKFNLDGSARQPLKQDIRYIWRIDSVGPAGNSGSESRWNSFILDNFSL